MCRRWPEVLACTSLKHACVVSDTDELAADILPYFTGEKIAPVPTYFIGCYGAAAQKAMQALSNAGNAAGMHSMQFVSAAHNSFGPWRL